MNRMKRIVIGLTLAGVLAAGGTVYATQVLDWADDFISATISCLSYGSGSSMNCTYVHFWDGGTNEPIRWDFLGAQHATSGGRAQAVEQVFTSWHESGDRCYAMTVNLARRRAASPPSRNNSCTDGSQTFVGSVSYTKDSCVFAGGDWDLSHRIRPMFDFTQETTTGGDIGYRSTLSISCTAGGCQSRTLTGCYKIHWF
jgi:hypothetical protein